ncbi:hypothetical protein ADL12_34075 [Streptomyces regalis]|uniref:SIS domain-containing protein n=2 Tax=Streptomyces regalis TaxID=68262 RepID=A0A101JF58_9ACTN|nr:hypothetical protein ADL12_34075 [Streptomyces regalis]
MSEVSKCLLEDFAVELMASVSADTLEMQDLAFGLLRDAYDRDSSVFVVGNGGSASSASHFVCDITKNAKPEHGRGLRATSLTDMSVLTAYANDVSYAEVFSRQLESQARPGDLLVVISASGRSPNIVEAVKTAQALGMRSIGLLGHDGGTVGHQVDVAVLADSADPGIIETVHLGMCHAFTRALRQHTASVPELASV